MAWRNPSCNLLLHLIFYSFLIIITFAVVQFICSIQQTKDIKMSFEEFWKTVDLKKLEIPSEITKEQNSIVINEAVKLIDNAQVFYREAVPVKQNPSTVTLLLLHGKNFSSKTWLDLGTIQIIAAMGYYTVAIDLPGYGNSPSASIPDRATFLDNVIKTFGLKEPVIVSPSMSGYFALPFLLKHWNKMAGYVPVAPVGIEVLEQLPAATDKSIIQNVYEPLRKLLYDPIPDLSSIKSPTLVVFGEKDRSRSSALLSLLPLSQCQEIPNGRHPAYLDDPDLWHKLLYNFLYHLSEKKYTI